MRSVTPFLVRESSRGEEENVKERTIYHGDEVMVTEAQPEAQVGKIESPVLTVEEAAQYIGVKRTFMYELLAGSEPAIPSFKVGRLRKIRRADADAFIEKLAQEAAKKH
jgi:excisionase family DNA binding protein